MDTRGLMNHVLCNKMTSTLARMSKRDRQTCQKMEMDVSLTISTFGTVDCKTINSLKTHILHSH